MAVIIYSTGSVKGEADLVNIHVEVLNLTNVNQEARVMVFNTTTNPRTIIHSSKHTISPRSARHIDVPVVSPNFFEVEVRTDNLFVIPYIAGENSLANVIPTLIFKYGDLVRLETTEENV